ncbi:MAG: hypothetical protein WEA99_05720 [Brumimicrobium sp.]
MKLSDKNIDQLFRDAAQNSDAPRYDHAYWNEVKNSLDEQDKQKRGYLFWALGGSVFSILLIALLFQYNSPNEQEVLAHNTVENNLTKNNNRESNTLKNSKEDGLALNKNHSKNQQQSPSGQGITEFKSKDKNRKDLNGNKNNTIPLVVENKEVDGTHVKDNTPNSESPDLITEEKSQIKEKKQEFNLEEIPTRSFISSNEENTSRLEPKKISLNNLENEQKLIAFNNKRKLNYYAKVSVGLMENYETSRPFQSAVFDASINVEFTKDKLIIRSGVGSQITTNADLVVSQRAKVYGFGITNHQSNLSYQSLMDIYVPLEFGYNYNNTSFGVGGQINYLVSTTMNHESLENSTVVSKEKLRGIKDGLNSISTQGYIWVEQKINNRFSAGVKIGTNLSSRINEGKYFNESATTNPLFGQLTLRYNLLK